LRHFRCGRSASDAEAATAFLDKLFGGQNVDPGEADYVAVLADLLASYEEEHDAVDTAEIKGVDALRHLIEANEMKQADLAKVLGIGPSAASMILAGTRPITADHARKLGKRFAVDAGLFL
jgi:antitoxin component HigA of HigAB toxin-antitoxin module